MLKIPINHFRVVVSNFGQQFGMEKIIFKIFIFPCKVGPIALLFFYLDLKPLQSKVFFKKNNVERLVFTYCWKI